MRGMAPLNHRPSQTELLLAAVDRLLEGDR
jgi:hypothetical protein